jgi:hypothetical protein
VKKLFLVIAILTGTIILSAYSCTRDLVMNFEEDYEYTEALHRNTFFNDLDFIRIDNSVGSITIRSWPDSRVELVALKKARSLEDLEQVQIDIQTSRDSLIIRSVYPKQRGTKWAVDYALSVPTGTEIILDQGVGEVSVFGHEGEISINLGVGDLTLEDVRGAEIEADLGVGDLNLVDIQGSFVKANLGTGDLSVLLRPDASYTVSADVGLGDLSIRGFANMRLEEEGFLAKSAKAVLGNGEGTLILDVGVGDLSVISL